MNKPENINVWSYLEEYKNYESEVSLIVEKVFKSGRLILGENVRSFENNFSNWIGSKYGTGVGNGTDAIKLSLLSLDIGAGDEVITVSNTAVPTVSAIIETGAKPVFCDVEENTYNINTDLIEDLITSRTKAILIVHLYGHPANLKELMKISKKFNLFLVEDCAQAHGSKYNNKKTGSFGDISAFSFYPTKILGGFGDGGMCVTNKKTFDDKLKMLRFYGMKQQYYSVIPKGVNTRLDEVQAAILDFKLKRLNKDIVRRRQIARMYKKELKDTELVLPVELDNYYHSYYLYVVRHKNRDSIIKALEKLNIFLNISYPYPIHTMPPFSKYKKSKLDITNRLSKEIFSLPMYPGISDNKIEIVTKVLKKLC